MCMENFSFKHNKKPESLDNCEEIKDYESLKLTIESISPSVIEKIYTQLQVPQVPELLEHKAELLSEIATDNLEGKYAYCMNKINSEIDKFPDGDERIRAQIGLILLQAELYKTANNMIRYKEALLDAIDYADGVGFFDLAGDIEKINK